MATKSRKVTLRQGKITKNKVRFEEDAEWNDQLVGAIYLPKELLGDPYPSKVEVTIEWV